MKRTQNNRKQEQGRLVLRRETVKPLEDDALHQARGGAGMQLSSGAAYAEMQY